MRPDLPETIAAFLAQGPWAVVGASRDPAKYGHRVLRCYLQHGREVYPVHPTAPEVAGIRAYPDLASLPVPCPSVSIITPPPVTLRVVEAAARAGAKRLWMQPGAESPEALARAEALGLEVIAGGPCLLVVLGYRENA